MFFISTVRLEFAFMLLDICFFLSLNNMYLFYRKLCEPLLLIILICECQRTNTKTPTLTCCWLDETMQWFKHHTANESVNLFQQFGIFAVLIYISYRQNWAYDLMRFLNIHKGHTQLQWLTDWLLFTHFPYPVVPHWFRLQYVFTFLWDVVWYFHLVTTLCKYPE